jgi:hypothetical protein
VPLKLRFLVGHLPLLARSRNAAHLHDIQHRGVSNAAPLSFAARDHRDMDSIMDIHGLARPIIDASLRHGVDALPRLYMVVAAN